MAKVVPLPTIVDRLRSRELIELLPELLQYADRRLRHAGILSDARYADGAAEAEDVVADAVVAAQSGQRVMHDDLSLKAYLCGIMWSQVGHLRVAMNMRHTEAEDDSPEAAAASSRRGELIDGWRFVLEVEDEIQGDEEVMRLYAKIADSDEHLTQSALAGALGWTELKLRATRARLRTRIERVRDRRGGRDHEDLQREGSTSDPPPAGPCARRGAA